MARIISLLLGPPVPRDWRALGAGSLAHVLHDGFSASTYLFLPVWQSALGLSLVQVGLLKSVYAGTMTALQVPAGLLAERVGVRGLLTLGTLASGAAFVAIGAAAGFVTLAACLVLLGVGASVQHPASSALIAATHEVGARRAALGFYNFAGDLGKLMVPGAATLLLTLLPWRRVTGSFAAIATLVAVLLYALLASGAGASARRSPASDVAAAGGWGVTHRRGFGTLVAVHVIDDGSRTVFLTFLPFLLTARGADVGTVGLALMLVFAGGAVGKFVCGVIAERAGVVRTIVLTELATAGGILLLLALPLFPLLCVLPLLGMMLNGTSSAIYGTVTDFVDGRRLARVFGLVYTMGSGAGVIGAATFGVIGDRFGVATSFATLAALVLATVPLALVLGRSLRELPRR